MLKFILFFILREDYTDYELSGKIFTKENSPCLTRRLKSLQIFKSSTVRVYEPGIAIPFLVKERNQSVCSLCNNEMIKKKKIQVYSLYYVPKPESQLI